MTCTLLGVHPHKCTPLPSYHTPLPPSRSGKGSRCEEDNNAFWSAAAALLPQDLIEKRQARAAGRILGLSYRQVV
jgi:hypothetical protein